MIYTKLFLAFALLCIGPNSTTATRPFQKLCQCSGGAWYPEIRLTIQRGDSTHGDHPRSSVVGGGIPYSCLFPAWSSCPRNACDGPLRATRFNQYPGEIHVFKDYANNYGDIAHFYVHQTDPDNCRSGYLGVGYNNIRVYSKVVFQPGKAVDFPREVLSSQWSTEGVGGPMPFTLMQRVTCVN